mgnify:CR=1 FL=1
MQVAMIAGFRHQLTESDRMRRRQQIYHHMHDENAKQTQLNSPKQLEYGQTMHGVANASQIH